MIGLEFADDDGQVFPVVVRNGAKTRFAATQFVPEVTNWDIQDWGGWFTITGNVLKLERCSLVLSRATAVGNYFAAAGYKATTPVTAIWRII